jgi:hypothetical protein
LLKTIRLNATVQPLRHKDTEKGYDYKPLSKREESIAEKIVDASYTVHKILGPGLLEKVDEVCFVMNYPNEGYNIKDKLISR